jgi:protein involved in polysaccharide export with SLBB domain
VAPSNYVLGPGDELKIIIWSELGDETVYDTSVNPEGQVYIPIIGVMGVSDLTVKQFENNILNQLSGKFKHFKGQVTLSKVRTIQVFAVGEVETPGAMAVSGLATTFTALYQAGGPTDKGSMRYIKLLRNNGKSYSIDFYDYLLNGDKSQDLQLRDGDTIFVPAFKSKVTVKGEVVRPAIYEIKDETSLKSILVMAGNIKASAYSGNVKVERWTGNKRKKTFDFNLADSKKLSEFNIKNGDKIVVAKGIEQVGNTVSIEGSVQKPGKYSVSQGSRLLDLINKAGGVIKEEAGLSYGRLYRKTIEGKEKIISFNTRWALIGDKKHNIVLKPLDRVKIFSQRELHADRYVVNIDGAVRRPGEYIFREGMKLADLIYKARGFTLDASGDAEIARISGNNKSEIKKIKINKILEKGDAAENIELKPLDRVSIYSSGDRLIESEIVILKGQVKRPGPYALKCRGEKLSSLIKRAGGLTGSAFPEGAVFLRKVEHIASDKQLETAENVQNEMFNQATLDLRADLLRAGAKLDSFSDIKKEAGVSESLDNQVIAASAINGDLSAKSKSAEEETSSYGGIAMKSRSVLNELVRIPIPLSDILTGKGDKYDDISLLNGDQITIPVIPRTVSILGAVINPSTIMFRNNRNARYYINRAGGFSEHSNHRRTVIVRANGEVMRLKNVRRINRGDIILVPPKPKLVRPNKLKESAEIAKILGNLAVAYEVIRK